LELDEGPLDLKALARELRLELEITLRVLEGTRLEGSARD
jgi:hypothetical protein